MAYATVSSRPSRALPLAPIATAESETHYVNYTYSQTPPWQWSPDGHHTSPVTSLCPVSSSQLNSLPPPLCTPTSAPAAAATASALKPVPLRPLPQIPASPTSSQTSPTSPISATSGARPASSRPLPTPPLSPEVRLSSSSHTWPADRHDADSSSSRNTSPSHSPVHARPLPVLPAGSILIFPPRVSDPINPSVVSVTPQVQAARPVAANPYRALKLLVDAPGLAIPPTEIMLDSPVGPISPLIFKGASPTLSFTSCASLLSEKGQQHPRGEQEQCATVHTPKDAELVILSEEEQTERVARGLSELGFVEIEAEDEGDEDEGPDDANGHGEAQEELDRVATPRPIRMLTSPPQRSHSLYHSQSLSRALSASRPHLCLHKRSLSNSSTSSSSSSSPPPSLPASRSATPLPSCPPALGTHAHATRSLASSRSSSYSDLKLFSLIRSRSRSNLKAPSSIAPIAREATPAAGLSSLPPPSQQAESRMVASASDDLPADPQRPRSRPGSADKSKSRGLGGLLSHHWDESSKKFKCSRNTKPSSPSLPKAGLSLDGRPHDAEEFVIRVELNVPSPPLSTATTGAAADGTGTAAPGKRPRRVSRLWVREKKGKRYVENDYLEVLALLRKL